MWTDNETEQDLLGFRVHADLIRAVVTDPDLLPLTIGVFADWGGGKTSLMKMLQHSLEPDSWLDNAEERAKCERTACLYFNGWLFEGYDDAKSAILSSVLLALGEHKRFGPKVRGRCVSLLKSVNWMRVASLGLKHVTLPAIAAFASDGTSLVPAMIGSVSSLIRCSKEPDQTTNGPLCSQSDNKENEEEINWGNLINKDSSPSGPLDVRSFRTQFEKMLNDCDIESLVVLIDDLDRCSPERIIENLEAIKLFLNVEHTAFVIGADPRIVRHAIAWKYRQHDEIKDNRNEDAYDRLITDYLEKLIQLPYRLPRLSPAEIETYMALLFCKLHLLPDLFTRVVCACDEQRVQNRYAVFGFAAVQSVLANNENVQVSPHLGKALGFSASAAPLITEGLKGNPRQVKRFLNAFILRRKLAEVANLTNIDEAVLVKLMILEYSQERQFRQLFDWQAVQEGQPQQIVELEKVLCGLEGNVDDEEGAKKVHPDWASSMSRRWIAMAPALVGIDLRDYFWIARDRLQATFAGLSMVPPQVRRVFDGLLSDNPAKINTAAHSAAELAEDELDTLFRLIDQQIRQKPVENRGYEAYRVLTEHDVKGSAARFVSALQQTPTDLIPPAVGMNLATLIEAKPSLVQTLTPALERIKESKSRAGVAAAKGSQRSQRNTLR